MITIHEKLTLPMIIGIVIILLGSVVTFIGNRVQDKQFKEAAGQVNASATNEAVSDQEADGHSVTESTEKI